ncbi:flagellar basal-body MS-ring/collar protein FliF [Pararhizobium sp. IMCC21322]|uniref:flagellar basal-body MS-ring/collar protein FliF n=1 Tax=Pararhizobium sp. IMCC21322 TaxID=3067903 RepID=UPI002742371D|nr:flagellar basal-body MS-ring/collar protein FliF [Pararhizobium sp. IMCC21322]
MLELTRFFKSIGVARLAAMGVVAAVLIGFFVLIISRVTSPYMVPLFTDLTFEDSAAIIEQLESQAVPYDLRGEGAVVLVPKENVLRLRMSLAESGLPSGGSVGYEIFDRGDTLGATSFVQNINRLRALEGELSRTIRALQRVVQARVHLVIPERQLFQRDSESPTASIAVKVRGELTNGQIQAIRHLVASAVPGLKPSRVSIVDEAGQLLANGEDSASGGAMMGALDEKRKAQEARLRRAVEEIVFQVVGDGRARVQVTAELERNRITQTADVFDPDGQVVRSSQSRSEASNASEDLAAGGVTVGNQLPGADEEGGDTGSNSQRETSEEVVNYEISRTTTTEVTEAGRLRKLSVAVLVDGVYTQEAGGDLTYAPRTDEQLAQIATLVRSAVGFEEGRGDLVEVVNMRFVANAAPDAALVEPGLFNFSMDDIMQVAELGVMLLMTLLLVLFVMRPLVRKVLTPEQVETPAPISPTMNQEGSEGVAVGEPDQRLEKAQATGAARADMVRQVSELVKTNPDDAATILRNWLQEAA